MGGRVRKKKTTTKRARHKVVKIGPARIFLFSRDPDANIGDPGTITLNPTTGEVQIWSTDSRKKIVIAGFDNQVHLRKALQEIVVINSKRRERKAKAKKKK